MTDATTAREEVAIVAIDPVGTVTKDADGRGFTLAVTFTLADGQQVEEAIGRQRKKDVLPALARAQENAKDGSFKAVLRNGEMVGTVTRITIGGPR